MRPHEQKTHSPMYDRYYQKKKDAAHKLYTERPLIYSPFFKESVFLGPEGFKHLCVSSTGERKREEQVQRFELLPLALYTLETTTRPPTYRRRFCSVSSGTGPSKKTKLVQWWTFVQTFKNEGISVRVVVRKVGKGKLHFWSVMLNTSGMAEPPNLANVATMWG
jgi:hypothetical protein